MNLYKRINTDTTRFLVPLLGYSRRNIINDDFINAYKYAFNDLVGTNEIVLVYKKPQEQLDKKKFTYKKVKDLHLYIAELPSGIIAKFELGAYSTFSYRVKMDILNFWNLRKPNRLGYILFPEDFMLETININRNALLYRKKEIWQKPDSVKETFIHKDHETTTNNGVESSLKSI